MATPILETALRQRTTASGEASGCAETTRGKRGVDLYSARTALGARSSTSATTGVGSDGGDGFTGERKP
jgi:hypothetical protein